MIRKNSKHPARAGVILLVVMLLLMLLMVSLLVLVAVTAQGRLSALAATRSVRRERPRRLLNEAFGQVVRGSTYGNSVMGAHSLLEDLYGNGSLAAKIVSVPVPLVAGALVDLPVALTPPNPLQSGDYDGRLLTFLTGPAKGHSTRVVGSQVDLSIGMTVLRVVTPRGRMPAAGDQVLINGRPFSGTGFGFQAATFSATRLLDAVDPDFGQLRALLPNHAAFVASADYSDPAGPGGAHEDYDAVDFQNMLLAYQMPGATSVKTVLPSLHRPDLINYWMTRAPTLWQETDFQRQVILRPLADDHPKFTGGNPDFDPLEGPWDVDNDNDGSPDSIWVDLGFATRIDRRGRRYKPLFAILCVDLDGRLNLNAHGNLNHLDPPRLNVAYGPFALTPGSTAQTPVPLVCGSGYGPAEINLGSLFLPAELQRLMLGDPSRLIEGRYGELGRTANGVPVLPRPGRALYDDALNQLRQFEFPEIYGAFTTPGVNTLSVDDFGTPPDLDDDGQMGLDLRGQPYYVAYAPTAGWGEAGERIDDPYELNLTADVMTARMRTPDGFVAIDGRFTPGELSAVLRTGDIDANSLPGRLSQLMPTGFASIANRHRVTTDSWDLPVPSLAITAPDLAALYPPVRDASLTQLLRARMAVDGVVGDLDAPVRFLLAPELRLGLRLDVNRPLGDGVDDNGNGVVDEPAEATQEASWGGVYGAPIPFDLNNDGEINGGDMTARQDLARHLYILMMLLKDQAYLIDNDQNPANNVAETARWIAQWAVNVVDFRDRDSIMTPFEYDINPFDGWTVDGNPATQDAEGDVVWGCERPQLLITETLAFHDRATEDLKNPGGLTTDQPQLDTNFDQRWMPQGSLFVELYNPWSAFDAPPAELADPNWPFGGGIDLSRTAGQSPVWRLLVVASGSTSPRQNLQDLQGYDPDGWNQRPSGAYVERSVYFADPAGAGITGDGERFYSTAYSTGSPAPLWPNCYAVIGPGGATYVGRREDGRLSSTRRISLGASSSGAAGPVEVADNNAKGDNTPPSPGDIKMPLAIVVDRPRRLSVSEPVGGYQYAGHGYSETSGFSPVFDAPLDSVRAYSGIDRQAIMTTGTTAPVRVIHLQRLANPLAAYDAKLNAYRTIDSMPVDLTSFTGRFQTQTDTPYAKTNNAQARIAFASRQRGDSDALAQSGSTGASSAQNQLWKQEPLAKTLVVQPNWSKTGAYYFPYPVLQTLGYLNTSYYVNSASYYSDSGYALPASSGQFWKSSNPAPTGPVVPPEVYAGDPQGAFPWLTWNNRPYVSSMELLLVPDCQSSQLLSRFSVFDRSTAPYSPSPSRYRSRYHHQLDVFGAGPLGVVGEAANLYRAFDFIRVASRFVASDVYQNPAEFSGAPLGSDDLHPPFNRVSTYREPGRVNLNTVYDAAVWQGMLDRFPAAGLFWQQILAARRGNPVFGAPLVYPTMFPQSFRSAAGATLTPLLSMRPPTEIGVTLLRPRAQFDALDPMFAYFAGDAFRDARRNPYFHYQALVKLANLTTTRSNVYAVWLTMGYFAVEPGPIDPAHPDGYRLGAELGIDTGAVERHRAFHIFDRSVPVGFKRGDDLNVAKGVLVKQFIE